MCNHWHFGFLVVIGFQNVSNLQFDTCLSLAILSMLNEAHLVNAPQHQNFTDHAMMVFNARC